MYCVQVGSSVISKPRTGLAQNLLACHNYASLAKTRSINMQSSTSALGRSSVSTSSVEESMNQPSYKTFEEHVAADISGPAFKQVLGSSCGLGTTDSPVKVQMLSQGLAECQQLLHSSKVQVDSSRNYFELQWCVS